VGEGQDGADAADRGGRAHREHPAQHRRDKVDRERREQLRPRSDDTGAHGLFAAPSVAGRTLNQIDPPLMESQAALSGSSATRRMGAPLCHAPRKPVTRHHVRLVLLDAVFRLWITSRPALAEREINNARGPVRLDRVLIQKKDFSNHQADRKRVAHKYYRRAGCEPPHLFPHRRNHRREIVRQYNPVIRGRPRKQSRIIQSGISATSCARTTSNPVTRRQMPRRMSLSKFPSASDFTGFSGGPTDVRANRRGTIPDDRPKGCPPQARAVSGIRPIRSCASGSS
jgi:hypothetical protein